MSRNVLADRSKEHADKTSLSAATNDQKIGSTGEIYQHRGRASGANFLVNNQSWIRTEGFIDCGLQERTYLQFWVEVRVPASAEPCSVRRPNRHNGQLGAVRSGLVSSPTQSRLATTTRVQSLM